MTTRTAAPTALAAVALLLTGCSMDERGDGPAPTSQQDEAVAMADRMFVAMMIPHHEQALEMSDLVLAADDVDPRVVDLAEKIKAAQAPEIETMQRWQDDWGGPMSDMPDMGDMPGMDGHGAMMSEEDMDALRGADGRRGALLFLEQMIAHHRSGIAMAEREVEEGRHDGAVDLAASIVDSQAEEIESMQRLIEELR